MCVIRIAALGILMAVVLAPVGGFADETIYSLMKEAIEAENQEAFPRAEEIYRKIIEKDPENYHALVRLAQLEMKQLSGRKSGITALNAQQYLLRACVAQPIRSEAYLALAQLEYLMGYVPEGDGFCRMAESIDPASYQSFCLLGQRYEDSGNYREALRQYRTGLFHYPGDPHLIRSRFLAAAHGGLEPYGLYSMEFQELKILVTVLYARFPDFYLLRLWEQEAGLYHTQRERYLLPMFQFRYCPGQPQAPNPFTDLYEAFIKASTTDPSEYSRLRAELDKIRNEALRAILGAGGAGKSTSQSDDLARARALYKFLKTEILKKYDDKQGITAKDLLDHNRYLCLNASILFVLIGREAGLPIDGYILPGHAAAVIDAKPRQVSVELTAKEEEGFGISWRRQFESYGGLLANPRGGSRNIGKVSPDELTAYQFWNVWMIAKTALLERRKEQIEELKPLIKQRVRENDWTKIGKIQETIAAKYDRIAGDSASHLQTGLRLMELARGLAPQIEEFVQEQEQIYLLDHQLALSKVVDANQERLQRVEKIEKDYRGKIEEMERKAQEGGRDASQFTTEMESEKRARDGQLTSLESEAKEKWLEGERAAWLDAAQRLSEALTKMPCSENIRKALEGTLLVAARTSEKMDDGPTRKQLIDIGLSRLPKVKDSEFYYQYGKREL